MILDVKCHLMILPIMGYATDRSWLHHNPAPEPVCFFSNHETGMSYWQVLGKFVAFESIQLWPMLMKDPAGVLSIQRECC